MREQRMRVFHDVDEILRAVGESLGSSDWVQITQERVDTFADATGDHQWIHVDVDRARAESPYGGPIAHGYLSLSLLPMLGWQTYAVEGAKLGVNYGSNKVRFPSAVPVGSRLRLNSVLLEASRLPDGAVQMVVQQTLEIEGQTKPAVVAETVSRVVY
jgi:acyl dehydratase